MMNIENASFSVLDSSSVPRSGIFFKAAKLYGKPLEKGFVMVLSSNQAKRTNEEYASLIDGCVQTSFRGSKKESLTFFFPYSKIKISKYSLTSVIDLNSSSDALAFAPKNWSLKGSADGVEWVTLHEKNDCRDLNIKGISKVYEDLSNNDVFFRCLRLDVKDQNFALSSFDIFGFVEPDSSIIEMNKKFDHIPGFNLQNRPISSGALTSPIPRGRTRSNAKPLPNMNQLQQKRQSLNLNKMKQQQTNNNSNNSDNNNSNKGTSDNNDTDQPNNSSGNAPIEVQERKNAKKMPQRKRFSLQQNSRKEMYEDETKLSPKNSNPPMPILSPRTLLTKQQQQEDENFEKILQKRQNQKQQNGENEMMLPVLNEEDQNIINNLNISIDCSKDEIQKGIFSLARDKFKNQNIVTKVGFVIINADTKKSKIECNNNAVSSSNCKAENWFSNNKKHPSIVLYFPYHVIQPTSISLKSHNEKQYGPYFLSKFIIEGTNDGDQWDLFSVVNTSALSEYDAEYNYPLSDIDNTNKYVALRVRSQTGKFGLSSIEIFGKCSYEKHAQINDLMDCSSSNLIDELFDFMDCDNIQPPKPNVENDEDIKIWSDSSVIEDESDESDENNIDDNNNEEPEKPNVKPATPNRTTPTPTLLSNPKSAIPTISTTINNIDSAKTTIDCRNPDENGIICEGIKKYGNEFVLITSNGYKIDELKIYNEAFLFDTTKKAKDTIDFVFNRHDIFLSGIKIFTSSSDSIPQVNGFSLYAYSNDDKEWKHVFQKIPSDEGLQANSSYYFPITISSNEKDRRIRRIRIASTTDSFSIKYIDFYGQAIYSSISANVAPANKSFGFPIIGKKFIKYSIVAKYDEKNTNAQPSAGLLLKASESSGPFLSSFVKITNESNNSVSRLFNHENSVSRLLFHFEKSFVDVSHFVINVLDEESCNKRFLLIGYPSKSSVGNILYDSINGEPIKYFNLNVLKVEPQPLKLRGIKLFVINGQMNIKYIDFYGESYYNADWKAMKLRYPIPNIIYSLITQYSEEPRNDPTGDAEKIDIKSNNKRKNGSDLMEEGIKRYNDSFIGVWDMTCSAQSIVNGDKNTCWISANKYNICSVCLEFKIHKIRISSIQFCTPELPNAPMPHGLIILGYDGTKWDTICMREAILYPRCVSNTDYVLDIYENKKKRFYSALNFVSTTGQFSLSYIKVYGEGIRMSTNVPINVLRHASDPEMIVRNTPFISVTENAENFGILHEAIKFYGAALTNFVTIMSNRGDVGSYHYDTWGIRGRNFDTKFMEDGAAAINFYFENHEVRITKYVVKTATDGLLLRNWCVVGAKNGNDPGKVLSHITEPVKMGSFYVFDVDPSLIQESYRVLRFIGLGEMFSLALVDFYGICIPTSTPLPFTEQNKRRPKYPEIHNWKRAYIQ